jgi:transcriptional regulator with XRE-family HTH domain
MQSSDLLLAGRKRAGFSQTQLAERLGRPQATIARWEKGRQHPPLETVVEVLHACGLELTVGMARYDDSYMSQIARQLRLDPSERVRRLAPSWAADGFEPISVLRELAGQARFVVVGDVAGALNGWPVMLGSRTLQIVPAGSASHRVEQVVRRLGAESVDENSDEQTCWRLLEGGELRVTPDVAGTGGYRDLARDAEPTQIAPGVVVRVASLIDLIRIAEASPDPDARVHVPALWATLAERRRRDEAVVAA